MTSTLNLPTNPAASAQDEVWNVIITLANGSQRFEHVWAREVTEAQWRAANLAFSQGLDWTGITAQARVPLDLDKASQAWFASIFS